ncbi:MAG TPA: DUF2235 domain-containing protein [Gemmatimonadaceae bacterium]|nr:DUF2235 domain-containing protein [Gemmatimonadaceae bacterium]
MPRNIVILSDGTGNSSSDLFRTNVWRLYQALDVSRPDRQVAYYHDGVGTESNKYIAAITGIFGYGLKRSVLDMYMFLCRSYGDGDRIFGLGFSRGSFAIRILMGMVTSQGLAPYQGNDAQLATDARAAYRRFRKGFKVKGPFPFIVPLLRSLRDGVLALTDSRSRTVRFRPVPGGNYTIEGRDPEWIHFVGLWDTVDAYGGPIEEITTGIDYWVWPLTMPNQIPSERIQRICHALSLDDERRAFWPRLFREDVVQVRDGERRAPYIGWAPPTHDEMQAWRAPDPLPAGFNLPDIDWERVSQVWFAGMHSDVGGSYPQDGLAHTALAWMMDRANVYGLLIRPLEEAELRRCANPLDKLNNSRRGFGAYYRYQPRNVHALRRAGSENPLCVDIWNLILNPFLAVFGGRVEAPEPVIDPAKRALVHSSVFGRIETGVNPYAPLAVPARNYRWTNSAGELNETPYWPDPPGAAPPAPAKAAAAADDFPAVERVRNLVWARRVTYFITVFVSLVTVLFPVYNHFYSGHRLTYTVSPFGKGWLAAPIGWAESVLPSLVGKWTAWAQEAPEVVWGGVILVVLLLWLSSYLELQIRTAMERVWRLRAHHPPQPDWTPRWPASAVANSRAIFRMRHQAWYRELFASLRLCILPTLVVWGPIALMMLWLYPYREHEPFWNWVVGFALFVLAVNVLCILWRGLTRPSERPSADD